MDESSGVLTLQAPPLIRWCVYRLKGSINIPGELWGPILQHFIGTAEGRFELGAQVGPGLRVPTPLYDHSLTLVSISQDSTLIPYLHFVSPSAGIYFGHLSRRPAVLGNVCATYMGLVLSQSCGGGDDTNLGLPALRSRQL